MPTKAPLPAVDELRHLGEALNARTEDVVRLMLARTTESHCRLQTMVEERFERVGAVSTIAVARWMAGEGVEAAPGRSDRSPGRSSAQLAAQRAAPLNEVTKRCLRWRDAAGEVLGECADELDTRRRCWHRRSRCCSAAST